MEKENTEPRSHRLSLYAFGVVGGRISSPSLLDIECNKCLLIALGLRLQDPYL